MPDDRPLTLELANQLQATQEQLRETRRFQEQTLITLSEVQTKLGYQQTELLRLAQVVSTDNERSLVMRLRLLEHSMNDLDAVIKAHLNSHTATVTNQAEKSWQIKLALVGVFLSLISSVLTPLMTKSFDSQPQPTPELPIEPWFPGPGEESSPDSKT